MPGRLATLLHIVRVLIGYGRRIAKTTAEQAAAPAFSTVAAAFGTYDLSVILTRVRRGIIRLAALENLLNARAKNGREIPDLPPRQRATREEPPKPRPTTRPRRRPFDPDSLRIPLWEQIVADVRRQPIGRTLAIACMDLAVIPGFCTAEIWNEILGALPNHGGSIRKLFALRIEREKKVRLERDARSDTWCWDWNDLSQPTVRQVLGCLIGEEPPNPIAQAAMV